MSDYKISISKITTGDNSFSFKIKDSFFENFTLSDVKHAELTALAIINKSPDKLNLHLSINGKVNNLLCDICAEKISINLSAKTNLLIKITDKELISSDDIIYLNSNENYIDLEQLIFEVIILNLPTRKVHPLNNNGETTCNKEMIKLIEKYSTRKENKFDQRWNRLKGLKIK